jgi:hypothetical protein
LTTKVKEKFKIEDGEKCIWQKIVESIPTSSVEELREPTLEKGVQEWLGSITSLQ